MKFDALEAVVGNCLVRIRSSRLELPGAQGWIGSWEIYQLPWHHRRCRCTPFIVEVYHDAETTA